MKAKPTMISFKLIFSIGTPRLRIHFLFIGVQSTGTDGLLNSAVLFRKETEIHGLSKVDCSTIVYEGTQVCQRR
jgi:hypothetical protein